MQIVKQFPKTLGRSIMMFSKFVILFSNVLDGDKVPHLSAKFFYLPYWSCNWRFRYVQEPNSSSLSLKQHWIIWTNQWPILSFLCLLGSRISDILCCLY